MPLRVTFRAMRDIVLANPHTALRGAFGTALRETVCLKECSGQGNCPRGQGECFAARFFDGALRADEREAAPSGFRNDPPKPFLLRTNMPRGCTPRDASWYLDVYCFDPTRLEMDYLLGSLVRLGEGGLGAARSASEMVRVDGLSENFLVQPAVETHYLPLPAPAPSEPSLCRVHFRTPTKIVVDGRVVEFPEFPDFIQGVGNRLQGLCQFYGAGSRALGELATFRTYATEAPMRVLRLDRVRRTRTSTRTGQTHPLSGFVGEVEYLAPWRSYAPWIQAGLWTGVGKHTQFGHGQYSFETGFRGRAAGQLGRHK